MFNIKDCLGALCIVDESQFNPANFDAKGNYKDPFESGDNDDGGAVSALGSAKPAVAPKAQKPEVTQFAKAGKQKSTRATNKS